MIEVKELRKQFGQLVAVQDVSFTAQPGQIFGLLAKKGSDLFFALSQVRA